MATAANWPIYIDLRKQLKTNSHPLCFCIVNEENRKWWRWCGKALSACARALFLTLSHFTLISCCSQQHPDWLWFSIATPTKQATHFKHLKEVTDHVIPNCWLFKFSKRKKSSTRDPLLNTWMLHTCSCALLVSFILISHLLYIITVLQH